ncbi:MAG: GNAT family N-acetyltransferase [Candidatus Bathyarchaeales archaeon]
MFEFGDVKFRPVEKEDLKLMHQWENDFELIMYSRAQPMNLMNMAQIEKQFEERTKDEKNLYYIVETVNPKEPIGIATIRREEWANVKTGTIGTYIGKKELWGKGYGKQITVAMLEMAFFHLNMERCEAWSVEFNVRAHKALEACGFKRSGALRETSFVNNKRWNTYYFDILRDEYLAQRMNLLKSTLGEKLDEYLKKHCPIST